VAVRIAGSGQVSGTKESRGMRRARGHDEGGTGGSGGGHVAVAGAGVRRSITWKRRIAIFLWGRGNSRKASLLAETHARCAW
jgi:hypothetical protein